MGHQETMAHLANPGNRRRKLLSIRLRFSHRNVLAKQHPDPRDPKDPWAQLVPVDQWDSRALTGNRELKENQAPEDHLEPMEIQVQKDRRAPQAAQHQQLVPLDRKEHPDHLDRPVHPENPAAPEKMATQAPLAHQETKAKTEAQATTAAPGNQAPLATSDPQDLVTNARRLDWPQAIKKTPLILYRTQEQMETNHTRTFCRQPSRDPIMFDLLLPSLFN